MWSYSGRLKISRLLVAAFCLTGGVLGYVLSLTDLPHHQVMITLESSLPAETQLFYDTGKGFNENESLRKVIYQANTPVTLDFDISGRNLYGLRFDPSRSSAKIKIHEIIIQYQGEKPFSVPLDSLKAAKDIKSLYFDGKMLTAETAEMVEDPILLLTQIGPGPHASKLRVLLFILTGAIISLLIAFFVGWVYRNCLNSTESLGGQI